MLFLLNHSLPSSSRYRAAQGRAQRPLSASGAAEPRSPGQPRHGRARRAQHGGGAGLRPPHRVLTGTRGGLGGVAVGQRRPSAPPGAARGRRARVTAARPVGAPGAGGRGGQRLAAAGAAVPGHRERSRAWRGDCAEAGRWELCGVRAAAAVGSLWRMCGAQGVFYAEQDVCVPGRIRGRCAASERVLCGAGWECVQGACGSRGVCAGHGGCVGGTGVGEQRGSVCRCLRLGQCGGGGAGIGVCRMCVG